MAEPSNGPGLEGNVEATVSHKMGNTRFFASVGGGSNFAVARISPDGHLYSPNIVGLGRGSSDARAEELQRRIINSQNLLRVNEAGDTPPQELGPTVRKGSHGGILLAQRAVPLARFLASLIARAQILQNFPTGARWSKMTDPSGRSAPGEINELLWSSGSSRTLWSSPSPSSAPPVSLRRSASTGFFNLGPPVYVVSEDAEPSAYWRFGLEHAAMWMKRLADEVPSAETGVRENLAPLPPDDGLYSGYEGIPSDFWDTLTYRNDHPALVGLAAADSERIPVGEVPTPYFPGVGSLLFAMPMMTAGWDGSVGSAPGFPGPEAGWNVLIEGLNRAM
ncbi:uncharacterized protein BXZ73DRAFT_80320 [Epithele typhae]|uniref:uncharacterized protein n=1 Tax=Epithele typhae TaxID=378194 RepID=UPI0020084170|nr:uncharacterized protein BXZ73DRAFT_80320 [Epithele typhae]KAH9919446.1 hypothetical protein BXZ73DRAFT_80320 [Epithele typhae]